MTTTPISSSLLGRASEWPMPVFSAAVATPAMPDAHVVAPAYAVAAIPAHATAATATTMTSATFQVTNLWLGGCTGSGSGKGFGTYASKRIHPGRLEGMT